MTTVLFNPHLIIRRLAEVESKCSDCGGKGFSHDTHHENGSPIPSGSCVHCTGTGRIVPFASLRAECTSEHSYPYVVSQNATQTVTLTRTCTEASCPGWIPEPDVEKACFCILIKQARRGIAWWLVYEPNLHGQGWTVWKNESGDYDACSPVVEEASETPTNAILCAARAWLDQTYPSRQ